VFSEPRESVGPQWYEKAAPLRAMEKKSPPEGDWRFRSFLKEGLAPGKILDVGCGDGGFLELAQKNGWKGVGFDYEERMIALGKARGVEVHASEFKAFCASRAAAEFDAITLFDVLEHTPEPRELLGLVLPLLKKGGHVALTLPNALRPIPFIREEHDYPPHHFTRWTPEAMKGFLERSGLAVIHQDAGSLKVGYLSDHIYFYALMPCVLKLAKRVLFGKTEGKTVTELYASSGCMGALANKSLRQSLVDGAKMLLRVVTWPAALVMWAWYSATRPLPGDSLYTLARREN
jgi:SAM-dependent methyltransferase